MRNSSTILRFAAATVFAMLSIAPGASAEPAFKIGDTTTQTSELRSLDPGRYFEVEKQKYEFVRDAARSAYVEHYFEKLAKEQKVSPEKAEANYLEKNAVIADQDVKEFLEKVKDHPRLRGMSEEKRRKEVTSYLEQEARQKAREQIFTAGLAKGDVSVLYEKPSEPKFPIEVGPDEPVRYSNSEGGAPAGCTTDCPITLVEYSEFECPYCRRVQPSIDRVLTEYKGKVRHIMRDFPLQFHKRAIPAAVAAKCAAEQGKYWEMYEKLFANQKALGDSDLERYAKEIGVSDHDKWKKCVANPDDKIAEIEATQSKASQEYEVTGTPTYFINGRRLSGALPFSEFKRVIDEELAGQGEAGSPAKDAPNGSSEASQGT